MITDCLLKKILFVRLNCWVGVIRCSPWCLFGVFCNYEQALEFAAILGKDYEVFWGHID